MLVRALVLGAAALLCGSCHVAPEPIYVTEAGRQVVVRRGDPPANAEDLGPISARHGDTCSLAGMDGTSYEGAVANLQTEAARRGANYVQVIAVRAPQAAAAGMRCGDNGYRIQGHAYRIVGPAAAPAPADSCSPPCSPGYRCDDELQCVAVCNPPCSPGYACAQNRTCQPVPAQATPGEPPEEPAEPQSPYGEPSPAP